MNLRTFYRLFYKHRIGKASFFLRLYIFIVFPLKYLINIFYFEKKVNLDLYKDNFSDLLIKDLNTLFEHFNSDKGEYFINQYLQPSKKHLSVTSLKLQKLISSFTQLTLSLLSHDSFNLLWNFKGLEDNIDEILSKTNRTT